jgi:hypothetical protein
MWHGQLIGSVQLRDTLSHETAQRLEASGIAPNLTNTALPMRLMLSARAEAVRELRHGIDTVWDVAFGNL